MNQYDAILQPLLHKIEDTHSKSEAFISEVLNIVEAYNRNAEKNTRGMQQAVAIAVKQAFEPPINPATKQPQEPIPNGRGGDPITAINNIKHQGIQ